MAYCRTSLTTPRSDVYVYCTGWNWCIQVARLRAESKAPCPPLPENWHEMPVPQLTELLSAQTAWLQDADKLPIDHPWAGQFFLEESAGACAQRLEALRAEGFVVPQGALNALRAEHAAASTPIPAA